MRSIALPAAVAALLIGAGSLGTVEAQATPDYDVVLRGGRVMDGSGNPWFGADVAIKAGRIVAVGRVDPSARASRVVDVRGKLVVPGFIDLHNHANDSPDPANSLRDPDRRRRAALNVVTQGVTTLVVNPDGSQSGPIGETRAAMERLGVGTNVVLMVGHNAVRRWVMRNDYRRLATAEEIARMQGLVRQGMEEGAFGLSAGLEYVPGRWSNTDEVIRLVKEIVPFGGFYIAHERSESTSPMWWKPSQHPADPPTLLDAVAETIQIGESTGALVVASHIKARGANYWGSSHAAINLIERARSRGVQVYADQYPYITSGSDGSVVLVPDWAIGFAQWDRASGGSEPTPAYAATLRRTMAQPAEAAKARRDIQHELEFRGGAENIVVFDYPDKRYIGRNLESIARERNLSPVDAAITLQLEGFPDRPGGARLRSFSFAESDVEAFARQPWTATASDGGIALPEDGPDVHPRYYGTFPRKIRVYALDRRVISVEHAIRSMTSLPAQILGLHDRGVIRDGAAADLAVIDLDSLRDNATFTAPHQHSSGVDYVLVNGAFVVDQGKTTAALPGQVLRRVRPSR